MPASPTRDTTKKSEYSKENDHDLMYWLKKWIYEPGYNADYSLIPFYDDLYKYFENIQKQADYEKNTGQKQAYGSSMYTYSNASNLVDSGMRTTKNAVYSVGRLSKRL